MFQVPCRMLHLRSGRFSWSPRSVWPLCRLLHSSPCCSQDIDFSMEKPLPPQLEHVQARVIETTPYFFRHRLDYTFYRRDVLLENQITGKKLQGLDPLMAYFGRLAVLGKICLPHVQMDVVDCYPELEDGTVRLRWRVEYISFLRLIMNPRLFRFDYRIKNLSWYDGYSIFTVDGNGKVSKVTIQRMQKDDESLLLKGANSIKEKINNAVNPTPTANTTSSEDSRN